MRDLVRGNSLVRVMNKRQEFLWAHPRFEQEDYGTPPRQSGPRFEQPLK